METAEKFINWLEGYLDASKNKLSGGQVREIRKKIAEYHTASQLEKQMQVYPLYDSVLRPDMGSLSNNQPLNEEFIREVEKSKNASTMEELTTN